MHGPSGARIRKMVIEFPSIASANGPPHKMDLDPDTRSGDVPSVSGPVLVVDDDETMTMLLRDFLESMGYSDIESAGEGDAAWKLIQEKTFGLVVLDWRLPKTPGLALFNRVRNLPAYANTAICISSGLLTQEDCFLLDEYPTTRLIEKPFTEDLFAACIAKLVSETAWHVANLKRLDELVEGIVKADAQSLSSLQNMLKTAPNPLPVAMNAAKVMRARQCYREAEALLRHVLERDPRSILALSELGKVLHAQGRAAEALPLLLKAQERSPKNLGRLCLLGEIELTEGNSAAAAKYFKEALNVDAQDDKARAGATIAANVQALPPEHRSPQMMKSMAGLLNITAISLIRQGHHDKGIAQYNAAFHFLDDDQDRMRIAFNLGLGHMRAGQRAEAIQWFRKAHEFSRGKFVKAQEYIERLSGSEASAKQVSVGADEIDFS